MFITFFNNLKINFLFLKNKLLFLIKSFNYIFLLNILFLIIVFDTLVLASFFFKTLNTISTSFLNLNVFILYFLLITTSIRSLFLIKPRISLETKNSMNFNIFYLIYLYTTYQFKNLRLNIEFLFNYFSSMLINVYKDNFILKYTIFLIFYSIKNIS